MFAGSGQSWNGAAFFPTKARNGGPVDNPTARLRLAELEAKVTEDRMTLNEGHFFDDARPPHQDRARGRRMTAPIRILDTGLKPARWNVAMTAALARAACRRRRARYGALSSLSRVRAARAQPAAADGGRSRSAAGGAASRWCTG